MDLRREGIQMDIDDYDTYYIPALESHVAHIGAFSVVGRADQVIAFDTMLGVGLGKEFLKRSNSEDKPLPDDWREFLKALASPYGYAILRAYRLKYGLEVK